MVLSSAISESATRLQHTIQAMRDQLTQFGSLLGASENVRVQKQITYLTQLLVFLTVAIFIMSFLALSISLWVQNIVLDLKRLWPL